eukprot:12320-Heterococcus_DN1.PRE.16
MMLDGHFRVHSMYAIHHNINTHFPLFLFLKDDSALTMCSCSTAALHHSVQQQRRSVQQGSIPQWLRKHYDHVQPHEKLLLVVWQITVN